MRLGYRLHPVPIETVLATADNGELNPLVTQKQSLTMSARFTSLPSMRRPVSVKSVFLLPSCGFLEFEPSRLCRHPSIRTLLGGDFRSAQVGRSHFSRCCYLIIDLASLLFFRSRARHSAQSPSLDVLTLFDGWH